MYVLCDRKRRLHACWWSAIVLVHMSTCCTGRCVIPIRVLCRRILRCFLSELPNCRTGPCYLQRTAELDYSILSPSHPLISTRS
uniref:Putative secreted protein n=1 Tax=Anopheles darlingi TaxID=43151 RepID=A0A2M4DDZ3_ANODA